MAKVCVTGAGFSAFTSMDDVVQKAVQMAEA